MQSVTIDRRRFAAILALRGESAPMAARKVGVSYHHLYYCLTGERPISASLRSRLFRLLGEAAWNFVTGQSDTLVANAA